MLNSYFSYAVTACLARQMQYSNKIQLMRKTIVLNLGVIILYYVLLRTFLPI